jgi:hypothetical protein
MPRETYDDIASSSVDDVDDLLNTKLNRMTVEQRSDGLHDVHGVAGKLEDETPEMLEAKVGEMNEALASSCSSSSFDTRAYEEAVSVSCEYVEGLKIPCLRAEAYNSQKAAERMTTFFSRKLELFGEETLGREITQRECLDQHDMKALNEGIIQVLPKRDRVGRGILLLHGKSSTNYPTRTVVRPAQKS